MSTTKNNEIELILKRLKFIKNFNTWRDVADFLNVSQATLSIWKARNSPSAKEKILFRCRDEDFGEMALLSNDGIANSMNVREAGADVASMKGIVSGRQPGKKFSVQEKQNFGRAPHPHNAPCRIPIISWVQAGDWQNAEDPFQPGQADEWTITVETSHQNAFALIVHGDSMQPGFHENDIITVDPGREPKNGDYIVAKNGNEATFKQLVIDGSSVFLKPLNSRYPIKDMTGVDFVIVGVIVEKRQKY